MNSRLHDPVENRTHFVSLGQIRLADLLWGLFTKRILECKLRRRDRGQSLWTSNEPAKDVVNLVAR